MTGSLAFVAFAAAGVVLLVSALAKLRAGRRATTAAVLRFAAVPARLAKPVAMVLPIVELVVGALLILPPTAGVARLAAAALFAGFSAVVAVNVVRGLGNQPCGCFGSSSALKASWPLAAADGATAVLLAALPWRPAPVGSAVWALAGLGAVAAAMGGALVRALRVEMPMTDQGRGVR